MHDFEGLVALFVVEPEGENDVYIPNGHYSTVNFDNTWETKHCYVDGEEADVGPINTIEFRQHQSTLDIDTVVAWVVVLASLVQFCNRAENEKSIVELCAQAFNLEFGLLELLRAIGVKLGCLITKERS